MPNRWARFALPTTPDELQQWMAYAYRRGHAAGVYSRTGPIEQPLTVPCVQHEPTPDQACLDCAEATATCPHGHVAFTHFEGADPADACWRPPYADERLTTDT
jgi:hypothetical protein